ncbi:hypothetical protein ABB37_01398 [Leptomonas pyrrhocoris]|uniref:Uncharacterized protein n=1 Tax=Leptomonas pyrrhocoris TaxID=157538 RepID=A0A0M9G8Y6_LEPPY|nr:hypothetical protein ABB37_01398 [Leptomonas pyrrhocoris]KPA84959.1 hypothetical protein ABB37_01398 [Leptomonas pyrrhocoris]|eukprot:XP_015663398.1 hypothetical protein ABB37_01398 [Leptomonas pyrrhocoris]
MMTIEGVVDAYSCSGSEATINPAPANAWQTSLRGGNAATAQRRLIPQSQSSVSLDTNLDVWDNAVTEEDVEKYAAENCCGRNTATYCNAASSSSNIINDEASEAEAEGCIPYDYESEMEDCSRYTFSTGPYSPATTAALAAAVAPSSVTGWRTARPDTPCEATIVPLPRTTSPPLQQPERDPHCPQWCERQHRDNEAHHASQCYAWQQAMRHSTSSSPDQMRYALRSFVREARCRELQALHSQPAVSFVRMDAPLSESRTRSSMRASCLLASATSTAQRKARYIQIITGHWKALEMRVEELLAETQKESPATSESHLRSIGYALNALFLFSSDPAHIIRELNMAQVEEQRRQRHDREAQLLATLETQGRLFVLPTLYAEESEEPTPVLHVEETPRLAGRGGEFMHPWQLLSPDASVYSLAPSSAPDSIGELSPSLSCCTVPSETCTPTWRASSAAHLSSPLPPLGSHTPTWKDMQPPRLSMLDLFMTAPAVVPSTVIANSETSVPYVMPVDPSYALHALNRQEALSRTTLANSLSSPHLSSSHVVRNAGPFTSATTGGRLQPLTLDTAEDSWGSFTEEEENLCEYADTVKFAEAGFSLLNFHPRESSTSPSTAATTCATLTDG